MIYLNQDFIPQSHKPQDQRDFRPEPWPSFRESSTWGRMYNIMTTTCCFAKNYQLKNQNSTIVLLPQYCSHYFVASIFSFTLSLPALAYLFFFFLRAPDLFIYLFLFLAVLGLSFCARAFSSCGKRGPLFIAVCGRLTVTASLVAEHRLQTRRLSNCGSRA